jgi:2-succinyl-5-enolpyruvyl-6-hydroxy-3-cyclohexene-1-carboxylate synthase
LSPHYLAVVNYGILSDLAELCARKGIHHAVLCPGSRSAPLTLAFSRNKKIRCWTFSDERSAAFVATGMAQQTGTPVVLVCTSGSAAYNFAPAIAEAYFQHIPLIVLTADRPSEWIDQLDGQTIRQKELFGSHVKKFFELPQDYSHPDAEWFANRIVNEAVNLASAGQPGPVHINAPFREPLYSVTATKRKPVRVVESVAGHGSLTENEWSVITRHVNAAGKILLVSGQNENDPGLCKVLADFHTLHQWPVAGDILGNLHALPFFCRHTDTFLGQASEKDKESLRPDLLITFGKSLVAKNLKLFLRQYKPKEHWHLQAEGIPADTFQSLTKVIPVSPHEFLVRLKSLHLLRQSSWKDFDNVWRSAETTIRKKIDSFFATKHAGEFALVKQIIESLPARCNLHLSNSMSVRYANHIGLSPQQDKVAIFTNRGTSGIDGCTSTAVGHSLTSDIPNVLITGDQAFFYDRNAFWHNYKLPNLFIVVLNNHGGIIFNLIDGPSGLPEAEEFFITRQKLNARSLAAEFGLTYAEASKARLKTFFNSGKNAKILEIESTQASSKKIFEDFKKSLQP